MNNNKYLTKIANLFYPNLDKTEFDMAFEGDGNPTRNRIEAVAKVKDKDKYLNDLQKWREDAIWMDPRYASTHMADLPLESDYNHLGNLEIEHRRLASKSGLAVEGPSKLGLGLGYGLGGAGLVAGAVLKNPVLAVGGGMAALGTGLYQHFAQPEKRYNRFMDAALALKARKQHLMDLAAEDGV